MRPISYVIVSLLFFGAMLSCDAQSSKTETEEGVIGTDKIEVYYFHNTRRCATCNAVEDVTKSTLEESYPEQMQKGVITFQSLNIEEDANEPLARELHVSGQTLLFVKNGKKKDLTNDAFMYARTNPEKLKEKIQKTIASL